METFPGAEFFESRLQRAQAVPPAQRSPEVQAFVESVQLLRSIPELLPVVTRSGGSREPALPVAEAATLERLLQASLAVARAFYLGPEELICEFDHRVHLSPYLPPAAQLGSYDVLGPVLLVIVKSLDWHHTGTADRVGNLELLRRAMKYLCCPNDQHVIGGQLQQLAASQGQQEPLLSVQQLQYACCCLFAIDADQLLDAAQQVPPEVHLDAAQLAEVQQAREFCRKQLVQLEPANPRTWYLLSHLAVDKASVHAAKLSLRALQLAQQQGSDYWTAINASRAVVQLGLCMTGAWGLDLLEAVPPILEAFQQAGPALNRCKRLLPELWVRPAETKLVAAQQAMGLVLLRLVRRGQEADSLSSGFISRLDAAIGLAGSICLSSRPSHSELMDLNLSCTSKCDGCGKPAIGLRACSGCKSAQYCSRECQVKHWRQHKQRCKGKQQK